MWFSKFGGVLHLENPGAACVSDLCEDGRPQHLCFTVGNTRADASQGQPNGGFYETEDDGKGRHLRLRGGGNGSHLVSLVGLHQSNLILPVAERARFHSA